MQKHLSLTLVVFLWVSAALWVNQIAVVLADDVEVTGDEPLSSSDLKQEKVGSTTDADVVNKESRKTSSTMYEANEEKLRQATMESGEKFHFETQVDRLLAIIINSLYKNKDIFLRELISNASDALDKIRLESLTNDSALGEGDARKLEIKISVDKEQRKLWIKDTGIGMSRKELINNLGRIAQSGTQEFMKKVMEDADEGTDDASSFIGQFGVGFYSVFLAADVVTVRSKSNSEEQQWVWQSDARNGEYTVVEDPGEAIARGTDIELSVKDDALEYLEPYHIKELIRKYSEFINYPIYLWSSKEEEVDEPLTEEELAKEKEKEEDEKKEEEDSKKEEDDEEESKKEAEEEEKKEGEEEEEKEKEEGDLEVAEEEKVEEVRTKKVKKTVWYWEQLNEMKPIWTRRPQDVEEEEYLSFYKSFTKDYDEPQAHIHFNAEGEVEFRAILYVPGHPPQLAKVEERDKGHGMKLYVRRVFITDNFDDMMPTYLAFLKGVVDSDTLPLNVSRETLQANKNVRVIRKKLVRKAIEMIKRMQDDEEKFSKFLKDFGSHMKLGIITDPSNRTRIAKLVRFYSSASMDKTTSLQAYVDRMGAGQDYIYYIAGETLQACEQSPFAQGLLKKGFEVLYLTESIDEYAIQHMQEFDGKRLQNISKEGLKVGRESERVKDKQKQREEEFKDLMKWWKGLLGDKVEKVSISKRLTTAPAAVVTADWGFSANLERIVRNQAVNDPNAKMMIAKRVLEINPRHPLIKDLRERVATYVQALPEPADEEPSEEKEKKDPLDGLRDPEIVDMASVVFDTSLMASGFPVSDNDDFVNRVYTMMKRGLSLDFPDTIEEEEEEEELPADGKEEEEDAEVVWEDETGEEKKEGEEEKKEGEGEEEKKEGEGEEAESKAEDDGAKDEL